MFGGLFRKRAPSALERAEADAVAKLACRRVHDVRELKARGVINGLLADVPADVRERVQAKLAAAQQVAR